MDETIQYSNPFETDFLLDEYDLAGLEAPSVSIAVLERLINRVYALTSANSGTSKLVYGR